MKIEEYILICLMFALVFTAHSLTSFRSNPVSVGNAVGEVEKSTPAPILRIRIKDTA
jgi:hypothetical protein